MRLLRCVCCHLPTQCLEGHLIALNSKASSNVNVVIPALNEEHSISSVIEGMLANGGTKVVVVDNGSDDDTARIARQAGAVVVSEPRRGYGWACQAGIAASQDADVIVFADGDACDDPRDLQLLVAPILNDEADFVIGSRMSGDAEPGALPLHSRLGNWLAARCLRLFYGQQVTDMGPFRAIRSDALTAMKMSAPNFGWTVEMQAKAALMGLRVTEVPVRYWKRKTGKSKITGSVTKSAEAGAVILWTIFSIWVREKLRPRQGKG